MDKYCPVCFEKVMRQFCPHCETDVKAVHHIVEQEHAPETSETLSESLLRARAKFYQQLNYPAAYGRTLGRLVDMYMERGEWHRAKAYLVQIYRMGNTSGGTAFRAAVRRKLGTIIGLTGDMPTADYLLTAAEEMGDKRAGLVRIQLFIEHKDIAAAIKLADAMMQSDSHKLDAYALKLEALARTDKMTLADIEQAFETQRIAIAVQNHYMEAIIRRATALVFSMTRQHNIAKMEMLRALQLFQMKKLPYEIARTGVDLAQMQLLQLETHVVSHQSEQDAVDIPANARQLLGQAMTGFRKLGAHAAAERVVRLESALTIGRAAPPVSADSTSSVVGLLWLSLQGNDVPMSELMQVLNATILSCGGLSCPMLGGLAVLIHGQQYEASQVVEMGLALIETLKVQDYPRDSYYLVGGQGIMPINENNLAETLRTLGTTSLLKRIRAQAEAASASIPADSGTSSLHKFNPDIPTPGELCVDNMIYASAKEHYVLQPLNWIPLAARTVNEQSSDPVWWRVLSPEQVQRMPVLPRDEHYSDPFTTLDEMVFRLQNQKQGGVITITGAAGSGKSYLLDTIAGELRTRKRVEKEAGIEKPEGKTNSEIIYIQGRPELENRPFGAILEILEMQNASPLADTRVNTPMEWRLAHLVAFRRMLLQKMEFAPIILAVDNLHHLDSGSLATLHATLPLVESHPLLIILTVRSEEVLLWQQLLERVQQAIPEKLMVIKLPPVKKKDLPDKNPADAEAETETARHVLECAAVLGERFTIQHLRRMAKVNEFTHTLTLLKESLIPCPLTENGSGYWQFRHSFEREQIYESLEPDYRKLLHAAALSITADPTDHAHFAGYHKVARESCLHSAEEARRLACPFEQGVYYRRALQHYDLDLNPETNVAVVPEIKLGLAAALLDLKDLREVEPVLEDLQDMDLDGQLNAHNQARLLMLMGRLNLQAGELAMPAGYFQSAMSKLREVPHPESTLHEQVKIQYQRALHQHKRGNDEYARSILAAALAKEAWGYDTVKLWLLLTEIHSRQEEFARATHTIEQALEMLQETHHRWLLAEPLEISANLIARSNLSGTLASRGGGVASIMAAISRLRTALILYNGVGDLEACVRVRHRLGELSGYRGEFAEQIHQYEKALEMAHFVEDVRIEVKSHALMAEALTRKTETHQGDYVTAFHHAHEAIRLATLYDTRESLAEAYLALSGVALATEWWESARDAAEKAAAIITPLTLQKPELSMQLNIVLMKLAMGESNEKQFQRLWMRVRETTGLVRNAMLRGQVNLLVGQFTLKQEKWNAVAREAEAASRTFAQCGATYLKAQADALIHKVQEHAPQYLTPPAKKE